MQKINVTKDVFAVGVKDWNIRDFHGYSVSRGITYNSYIVKGSEKIALIDTVKDKFTEEFIERVKAVTDFEKIDYIICNHIEMDHSGALPEIMKLAKNATLLTSAKGKENIFSHYGLKGDNISVVKMGDIISLGNKTLKFVQTPMLHWPDSMETYLMEDKILFSNDGFGQHYATEQYFDDYDIDSIFDEAMKYYANILMLYDKPANAALNILKDVEIDMIAPSHGIIWRNKENIKKIVGKYSDWANGITKNRALIVYDSMWGATEIMAKKVTEAFADAGVGVLLRSVRSHEFSDLTKEVLESKYIVIGSPTLNNCLMPDIIRFLGYIEGLRPLKKIGFSFGSYGWKHDVLSRVDELFEKLSWEKFAPYYTVKYRPTEESLKALYDLIIKNVR